MPKIQYSVYLHGSKESAYESAMEALVISGFTDEQAQEVMDKNPGLVYIGYEERLEVEFDTDTGMVSTNLVDNSETWSARN